MTSRRETTATIVVLLVGALSLAWLVVLLSAYPHDDAFIHFRIARNLVEHRQPYFNVGEKVMGDSSPLWMLLLAGGFTLFGTSGYAFVAGMEAAIVVVVVALAYWLLAGRELPGLAVVASALFAAATLVSTAGSGMETPLAMALLVAVCLAVTKDRWALVGVLLALGGACRYELFVIAPAAFLVAPARDRRRFAVAFGGIAGVGALTLFVVYGTVIPHGMIAKSVVYQLSAHTFWSNFPQVGSVPPAVFLGIMYGALILVSAALIVGPLMIPALRSAISDYRALMILGTLPAVLVPIYLIQRPMIFPWYGPLYIFPVVLGLLLVALRVSKRGRWTTVRTHRIALGFLSSVSTVPVMLAVLGVLGLVVDVFAMQSGRLRLSGALTTNARVQTYLRVGADLERHCRSVSVLAPEIGALGWTFRGRIIDGVGLVSPEVLRYHPLRVPEERVGEGVGAYPARAVKDLGPDVIVTMEIFHTDFERKAPRDPVLARYVVVDTRPVFPEALAAQVPSTLWASTNVLVLGDPKRCALRVLRAAGATSSPPPPSLAVTGADVDTAGTEVVRKP